MSYALARICKRWGLLVLVACCGVFGTASANAEKRTALVIGNAAYAIGPLANPVNDATAVAAVLRRDLNFQTVILIKNANKVAMETALAEFSASTTGADIALVYFAGHGTERDGNNYLIPTDARLAKATDLDLQTIALRTVIDQLGNAAKLKLVILDACRNNVFPLAGAKRSVAQGFARIEPGDNTLIAYAAKDGTTAADGSAGANSPFTTALLRHIATPGLEVRLLLGKVRDDVMAATNRGQQPHMYGTLGGEALYLKSPTASSIAPTTKPSQSAMIVQAPGSAEAATTSISRSSTGGAFSHTYEREWPELENAAFSTLGITQDGSFFATIPATSWRNPLGNNGRIAYINASGVITRQASVGDWAVATPFGAGEAMVATRRKGTEYLQYTRWLTRLSATGEAVWQKDLRDVRSVHAVMTLPDSSALVLGTVARKTNLTILDSTRVLRVGHDGAQLWSVDFKDPEGLRNSTPTEMLVTADGSILIAGYLTREGGYGVGGPYRTGTLRKLSASGTIVWDQTYARSGNETLHSIVELADGHFLIAGAQYRDKDQIIGSSFAIVDSRGRIVEDMTAKYRLFSISALGRIKSGGIVIAGRATANDPLSIITIDDVRAPLPKSSVVIGTAPTVSAIIELPGGQLAVAGSQSVGKQRVPWLAVQPKPN